MENHQDVDICNVQSCRDKQKQNIPSIATMYEQSKWNLLTPLSTIFRFHWQYKWYE